MTGNDTQKLWHNVTVKQYIVVDTTKSNMTQELLAEAGLILTCQNREPLNQPTQWWELFSMCWPLKHGLGRSLN